MVFAPANPTAADYAKPFAPFLIAAVPGAAEMDDAVRTAREALTNARDKAIAASRKFAELGGHDGPHASVTGAAYAKADDARRATAAAAEAAALTLARAEKARFGFMYGSGDELGALDSEDFKAQVEPLFAEASRRAKEHLDALTSALTERAEFADMLGRVISVDGVSHLRPTDALHEVTAYVDAGLVDESTREVDRAVAIVNKVLGGAVLTHERKAEIARQCGEALSASNPVAAVSAVLKRHKLA